MRDCSFSNMDLYSAYIPCRTCLIGDTKGYKLQEGLRKGYNVEGFLEIHKAANNPFLWVYLLW